MSYSLSLALYAPSSAAADLRAQLVDTAGANVGGVVSTGFVDAGSGFALWTGAVPDGHQGGVKVWDVADATVIVAFGAINPSDGVTAIPDANAIADALLNRDTGLAIGGAASGRTVGESLYPLRNGFRFDGADPSKLIALDPYDHDAWIRHVTEDPNGAPVTGVGA